MLIKTDKDKIDVNINIRNSKDNAYNTKVILSFTSNINYVKVEVRFLLLFCLWHFVWITVINVMFYFVLSAGEGVHPE